ncbi:phytanoyl-CoA dioxygenase family protein [Brevundimonas nasdae]|uniref:Phytanoyl-CoA dioxygenase family protein n=2 Tax=Bacteria TaxID=2 RepID=A0ABX8TE91_9CAUL|nr:phytanoyl-CoA dioxygenase family protein [Brevundimonas nasdae]QYC09511.1 phytanoyl-CoA dioxygenase family protein [Brevundimonas nasdae]QYC15560.1 phytanoyl-CoA dioxygenase family protein [Brevundimonas nasdae]
MTQERRNLLPGVPKVESPFFADFFDAASTSPAVYDAAVQLNQNGYAIIDFPDAEIDLVAERIMRDLHDSYDWDAFRSTGVGLRLQDAWQVNDDVRRLAVNQTVIDLLTALYGRKAWPFQTLNFPVGTQQHFHTDSVHFSSMPERFMCGVWIPLEDVGLQQGPLVYYPGSHKWPVYSNEHVGHRHSETFSTSQTVFEEMWSRLVAVHNIEPVRLEIPRGKALVWAANLLHGGDIQLDKSKTRWSQVTHYYFDDCAYYTPLNSDLPAGLIDFRRPFNIVTGEPSENFHLGNKINQDFIEAVSPRSVKANQPVAHFDAEAYLRANPDVAAAGEDAFDHWTKHGRAEGRALRPGE